MLSIAKLRVGQEAYQLSGVAQSLDDYYTGDGEAPGLWMGAGAERLGLAGEVSPDDLRAILAGIAPDTGGFTPNSDTIKPHPRRVPGFDLCFKLPKSLSVLYAVSDDPSVQGAIIEAGEAALRSTLGWLEREAICVRRGSGDERRLADLAVRDPAAAERARVRVLPATGIAAAAFRHRTSRAGDPLIHWHVLVPNLVEGPDGRWSAFVHPELFRNARAAGEVFQAAARAEVTARLGLGWRPGRHVPEVAGVPQRLCDLFSRRTKEVEAWLAATGTPADAGGRQAAVLATRRGKPELEGERFDAAWKAEALAAGWGPDVVEALLAELTPQPELPIESRWRLPQGTAGQNGVLSLHDRLVDPDEWVRSLLDTHLTTRDATFTRPQVVQVVASQLGEGASVATVERITDRVLGSTQLVPVRDPGRPNVSRWTSKDQATRERRLLDAVNESRGQRDPIPIGLADAAIIDRPSIGADQAAAIRSLLRCTDGVSVLVGPAGTGKTFTLDAVRDAYQRGGYEVSGAAPSARAALELATGARVPSRTLHRLLRDWDAGIDRPHATTLLIIDEAAMAGTRELEPIVRATVEAGGRVLLAGDHHQLPAVAAGGGFAAIATNPHTTAAALTVNRRQVETWEQAALQSLRDGSVPAAVAAYRQNERVIAVGSRADMVQVAVGRWFDAQDNGQRPVLLAGTNEVVDALNNAVRRELVDRDLLPAGPALAWGQRDFAVGDRVVIRRNSYQEQLADGQATAIVNGEVGTVVDGGPGGLLVQSDLDDRTVVIDGSYIAAGNLDHAYALTTTRAQGGTWDLAIGVGLDGLYREAGYTQLSRGSQSNWLVLTQPELDQVDSELARHDSPIPLPGEQPDDVDQELHRRLDQSRAKLLALARDPHADHVAALAEQASLPDLEARAQRCRQVEQEATRLVGADPRTLAGEVSRAQHTAEHLSIGARVKAHDRHNIGTVVAYDDTQATATIWFQSPDGTEAERDLLWSHIEILDDRPAPRQLPAEATANLDVLLEPARQQIEQWHSHLTRQGVGPLDAQHAERAATLLVDRAAANLSYERPDWLLGMLGPRPEPAAAANVWDEAARELAAYRHRHNIPDAETGLGPRPIYGESDRDVWAQTSAQLAESRIWLDTYEVRPTLPLARTRSMLELQTRDEELVAILDTAPADQRHLIDRLTSGDPLSATDTAALLDEALAMQGERRQWILEHWPHVVEHQEIVRTLDGDKAGPDIRPHLDTIALHTSGPLREAALHGDQWLSTALGHFIADDADTVGPDVVEVLSAVAGYRQRWNVTDADPLGVAVMSPDQAVEKRALTRVLVEAAPPADLQSRGVPPVAVEGAGQAEPGVQIEYDDFLGL